MQIQSGQLRTRFAKVYEAFPQTGTESGAFDSSRAAQFSKRWIQSAPVKSVNRTTAHQLRLISTTFDHIVFATEQMDVWPLGQR